MRGKRQRVYLAFDLGASSGRAVLGRIGPGRRIDLEEIHRFPNVPVTTDRGVFWDLRRLFEDVAEGMRVAGRRGVEPAAIGVDTWGVDFGLLDGSGQLLENPRCYRDGRNAGNSRRVAERIGSQRLQARTGSMFQDHASLCQLLSVRQHTPDLLARAKQLLFIPDLLRGWMCGGPGASPEVGSARVTDCTFASTSQMYDVARCEWAAEILAELDLPADILPPVVTGPTVVGTLSRDMQQRTGLGPVPVVAGCGHDTGAAFGICRGPHLPPPEDLVVVSTGTWAIMGVFVDGQLPPGTVDPTQFGYEANPDGSLRLIRNLTGGWLIEQCRTAWSKAGADCSYESLISAARAAEGSPNASAILDGQWDGFLHPPDMPEAIVAYCRLTAQPAPTTPGEFAQVIFASLADSYARTIGDLRQKTARPLRNLYIIGGLARNSYLNELTERRAGVCVIVGPAEATAMGNVAVQAAAVGCPPAPAGRAE